MVVALLLLIPLLMFWMFSCFWSVVVVGIIVGHIDDGIVGHVVVCGGKAIVVSKSY